MIKKIALCIALMGVPHLASAQSIQDQIISQLADQGFGEMQLSRTWLGRVQIIAYRGDLRRELVFHPQTGEILRDFWEVDEDDRAPSLFNPRRSDEDDEGRDNDDDDRDDDGSDRDDDRDGHRDDDRDDDDRDDDDRDDDDRDDDRDDDDDDDDEKDDRDDRRDDKRENDRDDD
ncbi:PepSY domain-containing protein [Yoonia litorea]|uniref:PepSY domain-containing protein n=1 Tax=Yoonia litorea TaxID=1123755 RepID=A0A1I6LF08_9RHOB|nr:PepSY domain-containing protein [Yoonia litorea]SFS02032.1 hypothetical protein SAMN05444714_0479 [Yoonia litorea]